MLYNYVFSRTEVKYLIDKAQYDVFVRGISPYMTVDSWGLSTIRNIYYDTPDFALVRASIEKPCFKEKLRLRCYGKPGEQSTSFIELKRKYEGTVYKRRASMPLDEAEAYLGGGAYPEKHDSQIMREIEWFRGFYRIVPRVYLAYDRTAYFCGDDPSLRMTFDTNIRSRSDGLSLAGEDGGDRYFKGEDRYLLEIKAGSSLPLWLCRLLDENSIYPTSFSKYGAVYLKNHLYMPDAERVYAGRIREIPESEGVLTNV